MIISVTDSSQHFLFIPDTNHYKSTLKRFKGSYNPKKIHKKRYNVTSEPGYNNKYQKKLSSK